MRSEFLGLRTVVYHVSDLTKAKDWYIQVLGIQPYYDTPYYVGFTVGGYELGLHPLDEKKKPATGNVGVYWGVNDVKQTFDRLLKLGASSYEEPANVGGEIVVAAVKDPWENVFGIIYNPDFKLPNS